MRYLRLARLTLRNRMLEEIRYPFQFVFNALFFIGMAYLLAIGSIALQGGGQIESSMGAFFLVFIAGVALNFPIDTLGTAKLEGFYLRPVASLPYIGAVALVRALETVVTLSVYLVAVALVRGTGPSVAVRLAIVGLPVFAGMLGIGLIVAGFRLIFHKIGFFPQVAWLLLLGVALGASVQALRDWSWWSVFAAGMVYVKGEELPLTQLLVGMGLSLAVGVMAFRLGERVMFRRGLVSQE